MAPRSSRESYFVLPGSLWVPSLAEGHGKAPCPTKRVSPGSLRSPELMRARPRRTRGQLPKPYSDPLGLGKVARLGLAALQNPNTACSRRNRSRSSRRVLTRSCRSRTRRAELGRSVRSTLHARGVALTRDDAPRGSALAELCSPQLSSGDRAARMRRPAVALWGSAGPSSRAAPPSATSSRVRAPRPSSRGPQVQPRAARL